MSNADRVLVGRNAPRGTPNSSYEDVTTAEDRLIRKEYGEVIFGSGNRFIHPVDPETGVALCQSDQEITHAKWKSPKPESVYPVGYKPICRRCGAVWRRLVTLKLAETVDRFIKTTRWGVYHPIDPSTGSAFCDPNGGKYTDDVENVDPDDIDPNTDSVCTHCVTAWYSKRP